MINRRHIRIKVMQSAYAMLLAEDDKLDKHEKFLLGSIEKLYLLYALQFKLLLALHQKATDYYNNSKKKHILSNSILENSKNFLNNKMIQKFNESYTIKNFESKKGETNWEDYSEIINIIWNQLITSKFYEKYLSIENPDFGADKKFIQTLHSQIIAPNDDLFEFYESQEISWIDDIPFVNTWITNNLYKIESDTDFDLDSLYKDMDDKDFAKELFRKTMLNFSKYEVEIEGKTPNWENDRITKIDKLLMVMTIVEFLNFPSIPTKVSINEYIELAKDYSTEKSSVFINGVLDRLVEDFKANNKIQKAGRGLL